MLTAWYGNKFTDSFAGVPLDMMQEIWARELRGYSVQEIQHGLNACKQQKWPPTLPEFLSMCRPPLDPEAAFYEAVEQLAARERGKDRWSHPAIYWATTGLYQEVRSRHYRDVERRWKPALEKALADHIEGRLGQVPEAVPALPAPGPMRAIPPEIKQRLERLQRKMTHSTED